MNDAWVQYQRTDPPLHAFTGWLSSTMTGTDWTFAVAQFGVQSLTR